MTNARRARRAAALLVGAAIAVAGCGSPWSSASAADQPSGARSFEELAGTRFSTEVARTSSPTVRALPLPVFSGAYAIWGLLGRDLAGHVWFGLSSDAQPIPSAHLIEYAPETAVFVDWGDVVTQLKRAGVYRSGEGQAKIHSRIVQGADGFLYFASMDEQGEHGDGSRLPIWGGHFWRVRPGSGSWEHLFATPEALIAVAGFGRWMYALGYFDHVLYQFDTTSRRVRSIHVGSRGGHVSRNFVVDEHGHAYVPRLSGDGDALQATLVEFDTALNHVAETPLDHYSLFPNEDSHGIVSFQQLADHSIALATDRGFLYRIVPAATGPAAVEALGFFHPDGESYVASMFTDDGVHHLLGVSQRHWTGDAHFEWVVYDLSARRSTAVPFPEPAPHGEAVLPLAGLYGSMVRDNDDQLYVAGTYLRGKQSQPLLLQVDLRPSAGADPRMPQRDQRE